MRRFVLWMPVLGIASLVYWTLALGLGGLSLMALTAFGAAEQRTPLRGVVTGCSVGVRDTDDSIVIHLQEELAEQAEAEEELAEEELAGEAVDDEVVRDEDDHLSELGDEIVDRITVETALADESEKNPPGRTAF